MLQISKVSDDLKLSLLEELFEELTTATPDGDYNPELQTWTHREWIQFSPVKLNQER
ncbi:MAG TPA: hypothetical protein ACFYD3_10650 [Candidatus Hypogeohydataceae bacterium YC41]